VYDLTALGWDDSFAEEFEQHARAGLIAGRVAVQHRGAYDVLTAEGELRCDVAGRLYDEAASPADLPAVGDWVAIAARPDEGAGTVQAVLPRRTKFSRKTAWQAAEEQVLAANVDVVFIMTSLNEDLNLRRLERYLILARESGAQPVVLLTKSDLSGDPSAAASEVESVAAEIPMWVFSEIMGLPVDDRKLIIELGDKILGNTDPDVVGAENVVERALRDPKLRMLPFSSPFSLDLIEYGRGLGEARRHEPRDDITTRLVEAEIDGSRLTEQEFGTMFILLTTAGNETTRHTISLGLADLLAHPDELERLAADPSLAGTAADELLRRAHPVHHFRRTATRDVEAYGWTIRRGDKVTIWYASANYDEEKFADPYRLDVGRAPNRHVTFGLGGPHFCLGAHLAKLEIKVWLEEMVPYLSRLELDGDPVRLRSNFFNGIKRMPVRVTA